ncbi:quillaic acid 3-O-glycosyltransferase CSL1-like [Bidens hawaiensis]|uniref:quillaic acid 3-O-glycosyltransferase CSL1-like n=1 Tax=Bidens hawaiensis TaxID=980011 RepID=UPI00404AEC1D
MTPQMNSTSHPLHLYHPKTSTIIINRLYMFFHSIAITLIIYYRLTNILTIFNSHSKNQPFIPHILIFISELTLTFIWLLSQAFLWRPITRTVFPERLPDDKHLPPIDVFICTADPIAEPPLGVMNTVISALALDYPPDKLSVYLSDDGGCPVTLEAVHEAFKFAKIWVPFCKKYGVVTICPKAYLHGQECDDHDQVVVDSDEFEAEKYKIKNEYESFAQKVTNISESERCIPNKDHSTVIEVMVDESTHNQRKMPLLVYVSREKRPSHPHNFKAGALNVLLRVSILISNSPYILGLDCDMYCNDKNSARQAMCYHLDPNLSSSLAFVQFPQTFHNTSKYDIYDSQLRSTFKTLWIGMDGIKGPCLSGTCYYLKREALYELPSTQEDINLKEAKQSFGSSNEFIRSLYKKHNAKLDRENYLLDESLQEAKHLASCEYENDTKWGIEVGFRYFSVTEDFFTSILMHCKHRFSIYHMPSRPSFMGSCTTNFNDLLTQGTRWSAGLIEVGLSRFSPIIYGPSRMSILQSFCYAWLALFPLACISLWILATIPLLSLLNHITIYPKVTDPFFLVFLYVFVLSNLQHMREIHSTGALVLQTWTHDQRVWMIKAITSHLYGTAHAIMEKIGVKEANFLPTNKVDNEDEVKLHQMGIYNFQTSSVFLVPLCSLVTLNLLAFVVGVIRITFHKEYVGVMFIQTFITFYIALMGYPVLEGMMLRKDKGRIAPIVSCYSVIFSAFVLSFGKLLVTY